MHFKKSNLKANYCMTDISGNELSIEKTRLERGLGLNENDDLMWSEHVNRMVAKEYSLARRH